MRIYAASHMTSAKDQISQTKMKFRYVGRCDTGFRLLFTMRNLHMASTSAGSRGRRAQEA